MRGEPIVMPGSWISRPSAPQIASSQTHPSAMDSSSNFITGVAPTARDLQPWVINITSVTPRPPDTDFLVESSPAEIQYEISNRTYTTIHVIARLMESGGDQISAISATILPRQTFTPDPVFIIWTSVGRTAILAEMEVWTEVERLGESTRPVVALAHDEYSLEVKLGADFSDTISANSADPFGTPAFALLSPLPFDLDTSALILSEFQAALNTLQSLGFIGPGGRVLQAVASTQPGGATLLPMFGAWLDEISDDVANAQLLNLASQVLSQVEPLAAIFVGKDAMNTIAQAIWQQYKETVTLNLPPADTAQQLYLFFESTPEQDGVLINYVVTVAGWSLNFIGGGGVIGFGERLAPDGMGFVTNPAKKGYFSVEDPDGQVAKAGFPIPYFFNPYGHSLGSLVIVPALPQTLLQAATKTTIQYHSVSLTPPLMQEANANGIVFGITKDGPNTRVPQVWIIGPDTDPTTDPPTGTSTIVNFRTPPPVRSLEFSCKLVDVFGDVATGDFAFSWTVTVGGGVVLSPNSSTTFITFTLPLNTPPDQYFPRTVNLTVVEKQTGKTMQAPAFEVYLTINTRDRGEGPAVGWGPIPGT